MKTLLSFILFFTCLGLYAQVNPNHVYVSDYYRTDGTYIKGHYRTAPNYTINDNFSTVGNVNPYTGEHGTVPRESYLSLPAKIDFPPLQPIIPVSVSEPELDYIEYTPPKPTYSQGYTNYIANQTLPNPLAGFTDNRIALTEYDINPADKPIVNDNNPSADETKTVLGSVVLGLIVIFGFILGIINSRKL